PACHAFDLPSSRKADKSLDRQTGKIKQHQYNYMTCYLDRQFSICTASFQQNSVSDPCVVHHFNAGQLYICCIMVSSEGEFHGGLPGGAADNTSPLLLGLLLLSLSSSRR
ncbi:MAG: hypothetical protein JW861_03030, partial [Bacteroidales bacterium]|nr:hypothetical protein [Bacteroidales bacterium]